MTFLLHAHSGLRYLVLLSGLVALAYSVFGLAKSRPVDRTLRILGAIFVSCLDLQVLLGIGLMVTGIYYPALIGHIVMMLAAAVLAHAALAVNRRRPQPGYVLPVAGIGGALALIAGGILAIGRSILGGTAFGG